MIPKSWEHLALLTTLPALAIAFRLGHRQAREVHGFLAALRHMARGAALFGSLGPLLGGLIAGPLFVLNSGTFRSTADTMLLIAGCIVLSYVACLIPALLTGLTAGALRPWLSNRERLLSFGAVGSTLTLAMIHIPHLGTDLQSMLPRRLIAIIAGEPIILTASYAATVLVAILFCRKALRHGSGSGDNGEQHA